jgi:small subunit ribosomal protein S1
VDDATQHLKVGDKVEAKFVGMDRKGRTLQLSIKAKDDAESAKCWRNTSPLRLPAAPPAGRAAACKLNGNKSE